MAWQERQGHVRAIVLPCLAAAGPAGGYYLAFRAPRQLLLGSEDGLLTVLRAFAVTFLNLAMGTAIFLPPKR